MIFKRPARNAEFSPAKMGKVTLAQGDGLLAGLNCFESGQAHEAHTHPGQDKFYLILEGMGEVQVGDQTELLSAGDAAFAPSGVVHSIRNTSPHRLIVMAILAPPPAR